jgi:ABC-2 type transport system ATP-binding protein
MLLNLVMPTAGTATIGGRRYVDLAEPDRVVGAVLEASSAHKGRTGRNHLLACCLTTGIPLKRADEVLELVGLEAAADRKFKGYSLGMKQRLGIAAAMLGDPQVLILDEPANGLDPEGIRWMREFLRGLAGQGRTVLVSSHLLSEMQSLADDVVILAAGKLVRQGTVAAIAGESRVKVVTPETEKLTAALLEVGADVADDGAGTLLVTEITEAAVGDLAHLAGVPLHHLSTDRPDLEEIFLGLTHAKAAIR